MVFFEPPTFYGYQVSDPRIVNNWLFATDRFFDQIGVSDEFKKVLSAGIYITGRAPQLDEVDKIGTMVFSIAEEKIVSFAILHPNIDFVIPDI
jgi:hypothetical protein